MEIDPNLKPFRYNGCSMWPDGEYGGCCDTHDIAYRRGGTWRDRLDADIQLYRCVSRVSRFGNIMGAIMFIGVRLGGSPMLPFPWRFGHGRIDK